MTIEQYLASDLANASLQLATARAKLDASQAQHQKQHEQIASQAAEILQLKAQLETKAKAKKP